MRRASLIVACLGIASCRETYDYNAGNIDFDPARPSVDDPANVVALGLDGLEAGELELQLEEFDRTPESTQVGLTVDPETSRG
jgi:hypothetical protein